MGRGGGFSLFFVAFKFFLFFLFYVMTQNVVVVGGGWVGGGGLWQHSHPLSQFAVHSHHNKMPHVCEGSILQSHSALAFSSAPEPGSTVHGGDRVCERLLRGLLAADQPVPVRCALAPAAQPLQIRFHAGRGRRGEEPRVQSAGLCYVGFCVFGLGTLWQKTNKL